jgi:hypothetical protein
MSIKITDEQVIEWICKFFEAKHEKKEDSYEFSIPRVTSKPALSIERLSNVTKALANKEFHHSFALTDDLSYEVLVRAENNFGPPISFLLRDKKVEKFDPENNLTYIFSQCSDEYLLFLISKITPEDAKTTYPRSMLVDYFDKEASSDDILLALKKFWRRASSVQIKSQEKRKPEDLARCLNAFLFQLSYNLDIAIVEVRDESEIGGFRRTRRGRRSNPDYIAPPKLYYIPDLTYHYQMGLASDIALLKYLSYYHVAEHFFDQVFQDDLIEGIKHLITKPGFSYHRRKDINSLINYVNSRQKTKEDRVTFNEQVALRLTIQKYVKLEELLSELQEDNAELVTYYKTNGVSFSDGDPVNLEDKDPSEKLSKRIYKTRNAIVHSKEGEKSRFVPFKHDPILAKEIPLLKLIAEQIIINSAESMK